MFAELPIDVQLDIFRLLDCHSRLNLSNTCKSWRQHRLHLLEELQPELFLLQTALDKRGSHREGAICRRPTIEIQREDGRLMTIGPMDDAGDVIAVRRSYHFGHTILSVYHAGRHEQLLAHPELQQGVTVNEIRVIGRGRPGENVLYICDLFVHNSQHRRGARFNLHVYRPTGDMTIMSTLRADLDLRRNWKYVDQDTDWVMQLTDRG